jgi:hypothetical protein
MYDTVIRPCQGSCLMRSLERMSVADARPRTSCPAGSRPRHRAAAYG